MHVCLHDNQNVYKNPQFYRKWLVTLKTNWQPFLVIAVLALVKVEHEVVLVHFFPFLQLPPICRVVVFMSEIRLNLFCTRLSAIKNSISKKITIWQPCLYASFASSRRRRFLSRDPLRDRLRRFDRRSLDFDRRSRDLDLRSRRRPSLRASDLELRDRSLDDRSVDVRRSVDMEPQSINCNIRQNLYH